MIVLFEILLTPIHGHSGHGHGGHGHGGHGHGGHPQGQYAQLGASLLGGLGCLVKAPPSR